MRRRRRPAPALVVMAWMACALQTAGVAGESTMQGRQIVGASDATAPYSSAVSGGGFVFVSAQFGTGEDGQPVAAEVAAQTTRALERLSSVLNAAGSSLAQTVAVHVYLRRAADFEAMNAAYRDVFRDGPPTRTTVVTPLPGAALVAIAAIAVPNGVPREVLHPAGWMKSPRPYSYIVRANGLVFLSGLLSRRGTDDLFVPGPAGAQVRTILENAGALLAAAGLDYSHVVAARVFLTDDAAYDEMNAEYRRFFTTLPPARATAIVELVGANAVAEITLIASDRKEPIGASLAPSLPLSAAVRAGDLVFLSGVLGNTDQNLGDVAGQTRETLTRIGRTLDTAGMTFASVVDATVFLPDLSHQDKVDAVYREFFPAKAPARSAVGARLATRAALVESLVTAAR